MGWSSCGFAVTVYFYLTLFPPEDFVRTVNTHHFYTGSKFRLVGGLKEVVFRSNAAQKKKKSFVVSL